MQDKRATMLGQWEIKKLLIHMAIPSIIGMVVNGIYNVVDTVFVGRLGTSAIGAVSVVFPFFMMIGAVGIAIGMGTASYISRLLGQGKKEEAERTAMTAIATIIGLGICFAIAGQIWLEPILRYFGATDTILPHAMAYARVILLGSPIVMLKMTLNNILRSEGSVKASMIALVLGAILNIILDPIFIFTFNMGIVGASTATVVSQSVAAGFQLWYFLSSKSYLRLSMLNLKPSKTIYSQIFKIGLPLFLTQSLNSVAMAMINNAAAPFGDPAVASMGVVKRVMMLGLFVLVGYSQGFQPVAGFNYGANNFKRLWSAIKFSLIVTTTFSVAVAALFIGFSETVISWFSNDPEVLSIGARALRAFSYPLPFLGLMLVYMSLFQALGKALPAGILAISRQGLLLLPAIFILPRYFGLSGVIYAQPTADFLTIIMTLSLAWMINRQLIKEAAAHQEQIAQNESYQQQATANQSI